MAFDGVFLDKTGKPFSKEIGDILETCVTEVLLENTDADPDVVVNSAIKVGERATVVDNPIRRLYAYAKTVISRDTRRAHRAELQGAKRVIVSAPVQLDQACGKDDLPRIEFELFVSEALSTLNAIDRQILWLHDYLDCDHATIAEALQISVSNSRQRLARARKVLREQLSPVYAKYLRKGLR